MIAGAVLLIAGLAAYSVIPSIHTVPVQSVQNLIHDKTIHVSSYSSAQTPQQISIVPGKANELSVNVTISLDSGQPSTAQFRIFTTDKFQNCMANPQPNGCLYNSAISNGSLTVPLNASATYYFGLDNTASNSSKTALLSASLLAASVTTVVGRDGGWNLAGLGLSVIGLVALLYGVVSRTVVPWE